MRKFAFVLVLSLMVTLFPNIPISSTPALASSNTCSSFEIELPSGIKLILDGELEDFEIRLVCVGAIKAKRLFNSYGVELPSANIYLFADRQRAINKLASLTSRAFAKRVWTNNISGWTLGRNIMINVNSRDRKLFTKVTVHELTHVLQRNPSDATWLAEGSAQYMSDLVSEMQSGHIIKDARRSYAKYLSNYFTGSLNLKLLESPSGFRNSKGGYQISYMAFDLLVSESENGVEDYLTCYLPERRSTSWRKAFEKCFDMSVNEFYDLFEEYKSWDFSELPIERREREKAERRLELARRFAWSRWGIYIT